jgi:nucleoside-diphosphate-sugar epimerase
LGEALVRVLKSDGDEVIGLDITASPGTTVVGTITDPAITRICMQDVDAVVHTATLHKPHIGSHDWPAFVETNVLGTLNLLEAAADAGVRAFVFTSTTSAFGRALSPPAGAPAAWITEDVASLPKNIYGTTKVAAEDLCEVIHRDRQLPCVVLRTSRFFPESDDEDDRRLSFDDLNLKVNELLYRRVDLADVVTAHRMALERAAALGFGRYVVSATTPFTPSDLADLRSDAPKVVRRLFPDYEQIYAERGWTMLASIDRVYVNSRARDELGWKPKHDFSRALELLRSGRDPRSSLARAIGTKGYHAESTGVYTAC